MSRFSLLEIQHNKFWLNFQVWVCFSESLDIQSLTLC